VMHGREESDPAMVTTKPTNKAGQPVAEPVGPRAGGRSCDGVGIGRFTSRDRLKPVVTGYFAYHAVPTNNRARGSFRHHVARLWRRSSRRRSQRSRVTWDRMRLALLELQRLYNQSWIVARHGYRTPAQVRADQLGLAQAARCRRGVSQPCTATVCPRRRSDAE
jgi:hypothetical protein